MRILLIHPGYSLPRHYNYHEAVSRLMHEVNSAEVDVIACDTAVKACGFRNSPGSMLNSPFKLMGGRYGCWKCQRKHKKRAKNFCAKIVSIKKYLTNEDYIEATRIADSMVGLVKLDDILDLEVCNINIGKDIWQSIQRYLFVGSPEEIKINKRNIVYEFIKSGVLYAISITKILEQNHYDYILTNERAYVEWGVPNRVALSKGIPVIHTGQDYFTGTGYFGLNFSLLKNKSSISDLFYAPNADIINRVFNDDSLIDNYSIKGIKKIKKWMGESTNKNVKIIIDEWFSPKRKTVIVFTHLCWDASITFGDMLYNSFESWLNTTYKIASQNKNVDWIFRIHPAEYKFKISDEFNTFKYLKNLEKKYKPTHIRIMGGDVKLKTTDMIPHIFAGITALGTVAFELPIHGIPCVVASKKGYAEFEFTISGDNRAEYEKIINNIEALQFPTEKQQKLAQVYSELVLNGYYILPVSQLFDREDANDAYISKDRMSNWLNEGNAKEYIRLLLDERTFDLLD